MQRCVSYMGRTEKKIDWELSSGSLFEIFLQRSILRLYFVWHPSEHQGFVSCGLAPSHILRLSWPLLMYWLESASKLPTIVRTRRLKHTPNWFRNHDRRITSKTLLIADDANSTRTSAFEEVSPAIEVIIHTAGQILQTTHRYDADCVVKSRMSNARCFTRAYIYRVNHDCFESSSYCKDEGYYYCRLGVRAW